MRMRQMSRGLLLTTLWEAVPRRHQKMMDDASRITVIGSVTGACGDVGWIVVRLVNMLRGRRHITLLAMIETVGSMGVRHRAGSIEAVTWANWTPDYPTDCKAGVYERMMSRYGQRSRSA